jgi:dTDP-4-amino-4,6-dideoxygalactose transaminase
MIPMFKVGMSPTAKDLVGEVLDSGMVGEGPKVEEFTQRLIGYFNNKHTVALNSCTGALTMALRKCPPRSSGKGTVISSPFTFPATNCAIKDSGASINWAEVEDETLCASVESILNTITEDTRAVLLTLVGGLVPHKFGKLIETLYQLEIPLILDCAHALGTKFLGHHISRWGDYSCFSFQSIKHLTTGDGGAITSYYDNKMDDIRRLKWFGMDRNIPPGVTRLEHQMTYSIPEWGYKFHMNDIAASIGLANWDLAIKSIEKSRENAAYYQSVLEDTLTVPEDCEPSWWIYGFYPKGDPMVAIKLFEENGIQATTMWKMNDEHACFEQTYQELRKRIPIFIPNGFWVTEEDREKIGKVAKAV